MRRGCDSKFLINDNKKFAGIDLGADFVSEHEWGIKDLKKNLCIPERSRSCLGIANRKINKVNPGMNYFYVKGKINSLMLFEPHLSGNHMADSRAKILQAKELDKGITPATRELSYGIKDKELSCAWDEDSFGIMTNYQKELDELDIAIQNGDAMLAFGGRVFIENRGLTIIIISRMPQEIIDSYYEADVKHYQMEDIVKEIGILERLEKAGLGPFKGYHCCSPRWIDNPETQKQTKYPVIFWVNPYDQQNNNFAWVTVEQLDEWIAGKGPIPKTPEQLEKEKAERKGRR